MTFVHSALLVLYVAGFAATLRLAQRLVASHLRPAFLNVSSFVVVRIIAVAAVWPLFPFYLLRWCDEHLDDNDDDGPPREVSP